MKRYAIVVLALVLGCIVFTGCRRMDSGRETMTPTTARPTEATIMPTLPPVTEAPATRPTDSATENATDGAAESTGEASTDAAGGSRRAIAR